MDNDMSRKTKQEVLVKLRRQYARAGLVVYRGQLLQWRALPQGLVRQNAPVKKARKVKTTTAVKRPAQNHPWRRLGLGVWAEVLERDQSPGTRRAASLSPRGEDAPQNGSRGRLRYGRCVCRVTHLQYTPPPISETRAASPG